MVQRLADYVLISSVENNVNWTAKRLAGLLFLAGVIVSPVQASSRIPFRILHSGGHPRSMVTARFNGHAIRMMVHSNASFFAQLRHADAKRMGVTLTGGHQRYGIDRDGHVSDLGLDHGVVASLRVGTEENRDARVSVFEIPQTGMGMLGVGWIRQNRVIIDFTRHFLIVDPSETDVVEFHRKLLARGYIAIAMRFDSELDRYMVPATINGITRDMVVHTGSEFMLDSQFADAAHVKRGAVNDTGNGPTGTHVANNFLGEPIHIRIGAWTSPQINQGEIHDLYGYLDAKRPVDSDRNEGGYLGHDFMQKTKAVVDFGSMTMFVLAE